MKACPTCGATYGSEVGFCPRDGSALRSGAGFEPGDIIRRKYEILGEIGRGGMGVVYRARHLMWNEEKAIKVLAASGPAAAQGIKGLLAEAMVMRQLQHPHIVRVEDADYTEDDQPFVVMEYVVGESVRQRLDHGGPLAPELALQIAAQTCSALAAAHQKGIIHRDMKPQNLLLAKAADGVECVKVIDFGIAKVREEAGLGFTGMVSTATGLFVGTPHYASPEQAQGMRGSDLDGRTDLYSLGLVLYEMLTGCLPFKADTAVAVLLQRLQAPPMPLDRACPGRTFPSDISAVVMKALEKERDHRYRSADEMQRAILAVIEKQQQETVALPVKVEEAVRPVSVPKKKPSATTIPSSRPEAGSNRAKWIVAALLVIVGIGLPLWLSQKQSPVATNPAPAAPAASTQPQPDAQAKLTHGNELLRKGDYAGAIADFKAALEINPGNVEAQAALRNAQSVWDAAQSPAASTFDIAATLRQASEKRAAGLYDDAITLYQSVLAHDAANREARRGLADAQSAVKAEREVLGR